MPQASNNLVAYSWSLTDAHQNQMMQLLSDPAKAANFAKVIFDLLKLAP